jgi:hypothetical protein
MRGLNQKRTIILQGYQIYHNYIRPHETLDDKTQWARQRVGCLLWYRESFHTTTKRKNILVSGWKCLIKSLSYCWYGRNKT